MARFSVGGGDDDGEGSSDHRSRKRLRVRIRDFDETRVLISGDRDQEGEEAAAEEFSGDRNNENSEDETDNHLEGEDNQGTRMEINHRDRDRRGGYLVSRNISLSDGSDHGDDDNLMVSRRSYYNSWGGMVPSDYLEGARAESDGERQMRLSPRHYRLRPSSNSSSLQRCSGYDRNHRDGKDETVSVTLQDTEVLDCCICFEPLTIPIFQCDNGHIACSSCCTRIRNKCPSCSLPIGYNRCRAMEKVLESIRVSCPNSKYGCREKCNYGAKSTHEKNCVFTPCSCPIRDCNFSGISKQLYKHYSTKHKESGTRFVYGTTIAITLERLEPEVVLQEEKDGELFLVRLFDEYLGDVAIVSFIASPKVLGTVEVSYSLVCKTEGSNLSFESNVKRIQRLDDVLSVTGCVMIPKEFSDCDGNLKMEICIWRNPVIST